jgi:hypothetical protein
MHPNYSLSCIHVTVHSTWFPVIQHSSRYIQEMYNPTCFLFYQRARRLRTGFVQPFLSVLATSGKVHVVHTPLCPHWSDAHEEAVTQVGGDFPSLISPSGQCVQPFLSVLATCGEVHVVHTSLCPHWSDAHEVASMQAPASRIWPSGQYAPAVPRPTVKRRR